MNAEHLVCKEIFQYHKEEHKYSVLCQSALGVWCLSFMWLSPVSMIQVCLDMSKSLELCLLFSLPFFSWAFFFYISHISIGEFTFSYLDLIIPVQAACNDLGVGQLSLLSTVMFFNRSIFSGTEHFDSCCIV